jgi:hypothetical protein
VRTLILVLLLAVPAFAQERPCFNDIEKFCKGLPAGDGRQRQCLKQHETELSIECQRYRDDIQKALAVAVSGCQSEIKALCKGVAKGRRRMVQCLRQHQSQLGATCKKSLQVAP